MKRRAALGAVCVVACVTSAGPLDPPTGPIQSTYRTLDQIEPRVNANALSSSPNAVILIDRPGSYYLSADVIGQPGKHGIQIVSDGVTLDLNGFSVIGLVPGTLNGIDCLGAATVRNGSVSGFSGDGGSFSRGSTAESITFIGNAQWGINSVGARIDNCTFVANLSGGIIASSSVISRCLSLAHVTGFNFGFWCSSGTRVEQSLGLLNTNGFRVETGSIATQSQAVQNLEGGFQFLLDATLHACLARENGTSGFNGSGSVVRECTSGANLISQFDVGDGVMLIGNIASGPAPFILSAGVTHAPIVDASAGGDLSLLPGGSHPHANFRR